jgi:hypothetical protein
MLLLLGMCVVLLGMTASAKQRLPNMSHVHTQMHVQGFVGCSISTSAVAYINSLSKGNACG